MPANIRQVHNVKYLRMVVFQTRRHNRQVFWVQTHNPKHNKPTKNEIHQRNVNIKHVHYQPDCKSEHETQPNIMINICSLISKKLQLKKRMLTQNALNCTPICWMKESTEQARDVSQATCCNQHAVQHRNETLLLPHKARFVTTTTLQLFLLFECP